VASFALISTIMPRGASAHPQSYRIALTIALVAALVAAIFGALPIAILLAAFAVPIVYVVYLYDVNLWEDEPLPVTGLAFGLTGVLTIVFMIIVELLRGPAIPTAAFDGSTLAAPTLGTFLLLAIVVPVVGEAIRQIGPLMLASRPQFDDLMDGLTFGVISGVSYACFDTIVRYWDLLTGGIVERDPGLWVSLIFLHGFVKPLLIGTATGLACAEFSGLGRGYDGFTPRYFQALALAIGANIAFQAGAYLFGFVGDDTLGVVLSLGWGLMILGVLILRMRTVLHVGLMEAALERTARAGGIGSDGDLDVCARCELPLMEHAAFCNACGTAVRVQDKAHKVKAPRAAAAPGWGAGGGADHRTDHRTDQPTEDTVAVDTSAPQGAVATAPPPEQPPEDTPPRRAEGDAGDGGRA
jgi:hypothetical protein